MPRHVQLLAQITGWKNSLKGVGYFIGAAAVSFSYEFALGLMLLLILLAMPWAITSACSAPGAVGFQIHLVFSLLCLLFGGRSPC